MIIVRYSEIGLKGKNRSFFEDRLVSNIKACLVANNINVKVEKIRGRIFVYAGEDVILLLKNVFGIASLSKAVAVELDLQLIKQQVSELVESKEFSTFRVSVQRLNKQFATPSMEMERLLGAFVVEKFGKKVNLTSPELNIQVEIADKAYVFVDKVDSVGGLPVGTQGKVVCLVESKYSLLAGLLMMKRGCSVTLAMQEEIDTKVMDHYYCGLKLSKFSLKSTDELDSMVTKLKAKCVVVGQTLGDFKELNIQSIVLRPLIGYDKKELEDLYSKYFN